MKAGRVALFCALASCHGQSVSDRSNFVEDGVQQVSDTTWNGERIEIDNAGVTASGGLALSAIATDRVSATARMLAVANTTDKASADLTITAATNTFLVTTAAGVTSVRCGHGTQNGSATAEESGCDALDVSVPVGKTDKRLALAARSGNGTVVVACDAAQLAELTLSASHGTVDVKTATTQGATITVVSETGDDVTLRLPADFQADSIVLDGAADKIDTSAFPDLQTGKGRGQVGAGAKLITVRSRTAGDAGGVGGRIVLVRQ
ncbi:MAG: hypothetical protein QOI41_1708 [Myxococcales bacterium]|nr:hypothetical protein [Myxococcales bacterium]